MSEAGRRWPDVLAPLVRGEGLGADATAWAMDQIMAGEATAAQIAAFLVGLRAKGESVTEVDAAVRTMLAHATRIEVPGPSIDIVGTGGDGAHTVNISTMTAIVVAACGVRVVKHGNRAASSSCGTADVLEELGVVLDLEPADVVAVAVEAGITFCFAPRFHPAMRHAIPIRRELAIPTIFNLLGPLANPAQPPAQAVGVADRRMAPLAAGVFARRGVAALVFRGDDGLDELTIATTSSCWEVRDGDVVEGTLDPPALGIPRAGVDALRGGDAAHNAAVVRDLLAGKPGPVRDAVLLNAAAALTATGPVEGPLVDRIAAALPRAAEAIDTGAAAATLDRWVRACTHAATSKAEGRNG